MTTALNQLILKIGLVATEGWMNNFLCQSIDVRAGIKCKFLTMSTEFDKNSSKWSYYSTDHKNYIKIFFEHFPSKLLEPQKSTFGDVILGIKLF